jgi:hypothetical protein
MEPHLEYLTVIFAFLALAIWWYKFRAGRNTTGNSNDVDTSPLSEHDLTRLQMDFEHRLANNGDLPDGIRGRDAYIYWNLMRNWFEKLIAANRYDDEYANKIRRDWCNYIQLLPRAKTAQFLARETNDKAKVATYEQDAESALRSIELIQHAFATAIGTEAMEELREVRGKSPNAFDRSGRRPMAPEGHYYFPVSISPYKEEVQPTPSHNGAP